jgi:hypothetical protein
MKTALQIRDELEAPFEAAEVKWKPGAVKGERALAMVYIDARAVMDRLDDVFGVDGWQDSYHALGIDGAVQCTLSVRMGGTEQAGDPAFGPMPGSGWVAKTDVGGPSEQPDGGDRMKAAYSDAIKRAAVKFGIGRYLYRIPQQWADYDPQKRKFKATPTLPAWALPSERKLTPEEVAELTEAAKLKGIAVERLTKVYPNIVTLNDLTIVQGKALLARVRAASQEGK